MKSKLIKYNNTDIISLIFYVSNDPKIAILNDNGFYQNEIELMEKENINPLNYKIERIEHGMMERGNPCEKILKIPLDGYEIYLKPKNK